MNVVWKTRGGRLALAAGLAGILLAPAARAADIRIGYVDSARLFQQYPAAQDAQKRFDRQVQGWRDEAAEKEKAVKQLRAEVQDQGPVLSALKRQEKEEDLQRAIGDYERFIQDTWGPQGKAVKENESATNEVLTVIRATVEKVAAGKGLLLVLDSASGFIVYADRSLDLTSEVLTELNAGLKTTGGTTH